MEAENEFGGTLYYIGHGTKLKIKFGGNVADVWWNGPLRWTQKRNGSRK